MRRETGGWIHAGDVRRFAETKDPDAAVRDLVGLGWWDYPAGDDRYPDADPDYNPGGDPSLFVIVANMDDQPEPDVIEARRRRTAERVRRHRRRMAGLDPNDPPGNGVTGPVTERVTRVGSGRDYVPTTRLTAVQDQDQNHHQIARAEGEAAGGEPQPTPSQSLRDHDGPDKGGPGAQQTSTGVHLQSPAADRNAREGEGNRVPCPRCGFNAAVTATGRLRPHGPRNARGAFACMGQAAP